jgi:hypothetical protein
MQTLPHFIGPHANTGRTEHDAHDNDYNGKNVLEGYMVTNCGASVHFALPNKSAFKILTCTLRLLLTAKSCICRQASVEGLVHVAQGVLNPDEELVAASDKCF